MLSDAKKVLDEPSSTPSSLKEAKQKLEKGFEELAKQAAQAGPDSSSSSGEDSAKTQSGGSEKSKEDDIVDADFEVVDDDKEEKKGS